MASEVGGEIKWTFTADDSQLNAKLASARKNIKATASETAKDTNQTFAQSAQRVSDNFNRVGQQLTRVGSTFTKAVTIPVVAGFYAIGKAGINFESSFAGVRKTVNATEQEFADLQNRFRNISLKTPIDVNELNRIGELAGQLGVSGVDNLEKFTKTIADISVTTNLTSEAASTDFARIANIMQEPIDNVDRMGATVVDLGNNFATTESEVVDFANRIAGAGKTAGLTTADIFGISTAFSSVGVQAERGGTAVSKVLFRMAESVSSGGDELTKFAEVAGTSVGDFKNLFEKDAVQAFDKFVAGLGSAGIGATGFLDDLELGDERLRQSFISVAGAGGTMTDSIKTAGQAWDENTALVVEADKRYGTVQSKIQVAKNKLNDLGITLSEVLLPPFTEVVNRIGGLVDGFKGLSPELQKTILKVAGMAAIFGPVVLIAGQFATAIAALATPAGLVVIALGLFIAQVIYTVKQMKKSFKAIVDIGKNAIDGIKKLFEDPKKIVEGLYEIPRIALDVMLKTYDAIISGLSKVRAALPGIKDSIVGFFNDLPAVMGKIFEDVKNSIIKGLSIGTDVAGRATEFIVNEFKLLPGRIAGALKDIGKKIVATWTIAADIAGYMVTTFIPDVWSAASTAVVQIVRDVGRAIGAAIVVGLSAASTGVGASAARVLNGVSDAFDNSKSTISRKASELWDAVAEAFNSSKDSIAAKTREMTAIISNEFTRFKDSAPGSFGPVGDSIIDAIYGRVESNADSIGTILEDTLVSRLKIVQDKMTAAGEGIANSLLGAGNSIADFFISADATISNIGTSISGSLLNAGNSIVNFGVSATIDFQKWLNDTLLAVGQWSINLQDSITTAFTGLVTGEESGDGKNLMDRTVGAWSDSLLNWFQSLPDTVTTWVQSFGKDEQVNSAWGKAGADGVVSFFDGINENRESLILKLVKFLAIVVAGIAALIVTEFINLGLILIGGLVRGLISSGKAIGDALRTSTVTAIQTAVDWSKILYDSGKNIASGLLDGLKSKAQDVYDFLAELGNKAKDAFNGILGIESPSKVFIDSGQNIVAGLVKGIDSGKNVASVSVGSLANEVLSQAPQNVSNNTNNNSSNKTINNTFVIDSDSRLEAAKRYMEDRELRNKFGFSQ